MRRQINRIRISLVTVAAVIALGALLHWLSDGGVGKAFGPRASGQQAPQPPTSSGNPAPTKREADIARRFGQGVTMLHAKQYEHAVTAFHRVLAEAPRMPEAHVNMGFAMLGLSRHGIAQEFFESAIALRPSQINAYYGLAVALEEQGDLRGAVGAMRVFVHLSPPDDPFLRKANAALWEWSSALPSSPEATSRP